MRHNVSFEAPPLKRPPDHHGIIPWNGELFGQIIPYSMAVWAQTPQTLGAFGRDQR